MDLALTDDQRLFQETTRRFLATTCPTATARAWAADEPAGFPADWWRRGAELGWCSLLVPEDQGGGSVSGHGVADAALVAEEMGRAVAPGPLLGVNVVAAALAEAGSDPKLLGRLVAGEATAAWSLAAPAAGLTPGAVVRAVPRGTAWVLDGSTGPVEAPVDAVLVSASSGDGVVQVVVRPDRPGVEVLAAQGLDLGRRFSALRFEALEIGPDDVVGEPEHAAAAVERQLRLAVVLQCAEMAGVLERVFEMTVEYASDRCSFGRPLASYQALKHRFADMKLWLESSHASVTAAVRAVQSGGDGASEAASVAKAYIGSKGPALLQDCVQLHGGIGVTWDHDLHLFLRRLVQETSRFGTPTEHRERIARFVGLGPPR